MPDVVNESRRDSFMSGMVAVMFKDAWYFQEDIVKAYESYYETKYRRAAILEKRLIKKLLDALGSVKTLLEVGCGTCFFTRWLECVGFKSYGIDISPLMLNEAKARWPRGPLFRGEAAHLPFREKSFDAAVFITCLEYMPHIRDVLREATRVARKGLVLGLMNRWSLPTLRRMIQIKLGRNPYYRNSRFYSILGIKRILKEVLPNGYSIPLWKTVVFPRPLGGFESSIFPFGAFLGLAVKLGG